MVIIIWNKGKNMKTKLICMIIVVITLTALLPHFVFATKVEGSSGDIDWEINTSTFEEITKDYGQNQFNKMKDEAKADIKAEAGTKTKKLNGTFSLGASLAEAVLALFVAPAIVVSLMITIVTRGSEWLTKSGSLYGVKWFTIQDCVNNKIPLFDADFFSFDSNDKEFNGVIKTSVAVYYNFVRVIAVLLGLLTLIYCGIRMALSTVASEQAKYKEMLKDWFVSMVLIFMLPYVLGLISLVANAVTELFTSLTPEGFEQNLLGQVTNFLNISSGWTYVAITLLYLVIVYYQIKFFLMYFKRMLSMGFLILISPLVASFYSIDKTKISGKGGKSMYLTNWMNEYSVNVFIQPVHAAVYMVFIVTAGTIFDKAPFLTVLLFMSLSRTEKIVKNVLGMRNRTSIHSMSDYFQGRKHLESFARGGAH